MRQAVRAVSAWTDLINHSVEFHCCPKAKWGRGLQSKHIRYMLRTLARLAVHPWFISALNAWFIFLIFNSVTDLFLTRATPHKEAEEIIEGVGIVLIAWGVALEERQKLREVFGLFHHGDTQKVRYEEALDENCHRYGLGLLLLGLFSEVCVESVKIPDRIINTAGIESLVLLLSSSLLVAAGLLMIRQITFLLFQSKRNTTAAE